MKKNKPASTTVKRVTVRFTEEQFITFKERAREWQQDGIGSRSLNDWCLKQLIGQEDRERTDRTA